MGVGSGRIGNHAWTWQPCQTAKVLGPIVPASQLTMLVMMCLVMLHKYLHESGRLSSMAYACVQYALAFCLTLGEPNPMRSA